ncbi:MAG: gamma-glutamylcyclotransferase [Proteobacteria bacterium]|nr:gamma-glutamylcyclotransferase [Pseudomonadota bacterium]
MHRVFVFGTLKEGFPNFATNKGRRIAGDFVTSQAYPLYLMGERHSPWLVDLPGAGLQVHGQVFEVDDETLAAMDRLERVHEPDGYLRTRVAVEPAMQDMGRQAIEVFAYLKRAVQLDASQVRLGPLPDYTLAHAALYRPRIVV